MHAQNISAKEKVNDAFWPIINEALQIYKNHFDTHLCGVFLVGSVSRGAEVPHISDIDVIAVIDRPQTDVDKDFLSQKMHQMKPHVQTLDLAKIDLVAVELSVFKSSVSQQFMLGIDGLQIYGEDLGFDLEIPEVGPELARLLNGRFAKHRARAAELLDDPKGETYMPGRSRWIAKKTIRLALGIVMSQKPIFEHSIPETAKTVGRELPHLKDVISRLDSVIDSPPTDSEAYRALLQDVDVIYEAAKVQGVCD